MVSFYIILQTIDDHEVSLPAAITPQAIYLALCPLRVSSKDTGYMLCVNGGRITSWSYLEGAWEEEDEETL